MIINTIVVLSLIIRFARPHRTQSEYHEEQLANGVTEYREFIDSGCTVVASGGLITPDVLHSLEYNVNFILKLLADLYSWDLPSLEDATVAAAADENSKMVVKKQPLEQRSPLKTVACLLLPSLLAFLHICTNELSAFFRLHRLHTILCSVTPSVVLQGCAMISDRSTYMCDANTVKMLHDIHKEFPGAQTTATAEHHERGATFVVKAFESVNSIDKHRMLTKLPHWVGPRRNVFGEVTESDFFAPCSRWIDEKDSDDLETRLCVLNEKYAIKTDAAVVYVTGQEEAHVSHPVNRLFTRALKKIVAHFGHKVRNQSDDDWSFGRDSVVGNLLAFLDKRCALVPSVLVYFADNCDANDTAIPFGLFLTLCANWASFLDMYCPRGGDSLHERACVTNGILDRLLVNFYWATNEHLIYEDDENDHAYNYLADTSVAVTDCYVLTDANIDNDLPIWSTSDWLIGRHLLAHHHRGAGKPLEEVTIMLTGNDHRDAAEVLLTEAYDLLLPWHLDAYNVLAFHAALIGHEQLVMDDFVYRHAEVVRLYLDRVSGPVNVMTLVNSLSDTIRWYAEYERVFHDYLCLQAPREPPPPRPVDVVVSAIKSLNRFKMKDLITQYAENVMGAITEDKRAELLAWADRQLSGFEETEHPQRLNRMLEDNCAKAMAYLKSLIEIAVESNVVLKNNVQVRVNCEELVTDVFVTKNYIEGTKIPCTVM